MRAWKTVPGLSALVALSLTGCGSDDESPSGIFVPGKLDGGPKDPADGLFAVTFDVVVPVDTPAVPEVHVAGDFQSWDPTAESHRLTRVQPHRWQATFRLPAGPIEYKYAREDWSRVEKGQAGEEVTNRRAVIEADITLEDEVASWNDRPTRPSTITGDVRQIEALDRPVWVYLPPGYEENPNRKYPVLYMLDGQNLFDVRTSFLTEWRVDESAERLIREGEMAPLIIVGIANAGGDRLIEYTPWVDDGRGGGSGHRHLQAIVDELMPVIDRDFRTLTQTASTGIAGSSLGGLMAAYAGFAFRSEFGRVAAISPSIWWNNERLVTFVEVGSRPLTMPFYADMGTLENGGIPALRRLRAALVHAGFVEGKDLFIKEFEGAGHNENSWSARMPDILKRLFPAEP